jgi:hypothetical protein
VLFVQRVQKPFILACIFLSRLRFIGVLAGVHVNGYVTLPDGSKELWVARRSKTKPTWQVSLLCSWPC